jgi:hypothetical protein
VCATGANEKGFGTTEALYASALALARRSALSALKRPPTASIVGPHSIFQTPLHGFIARTSGSVLAGHCTSLNRIPHHGRTVPPFDCAVKEGLIPAQNGARCARLIACQGDLSGYPAM